jgi:hypothetical protein
MREERASVNARFSPFFGVPALKVMARKHKKNRFITR